MSTDLSVVIPCFNEEEVLRGTVSSVREALSPLSLSCELILVDDGSADGTGSLIDGLAKERSEVRACHLPSHQGKGAALTYGLGHATGEIAAFIDADLEIDPSFLVPLVEAVRDGVSIAIGSKRAGSEKAVQRTLLRRMSTAMYNNLVRVVLNSKLQDHQAGIKAFRHHVLAVVLPAMTSGGWIWDTEFLARAQNLGFDIREIPIDVVRQRSSKVNLFVDSLRMLSGVMNLYRQGLRVRHPREGTHGRQVG